MRFGRTLALAFLVSLSVAACGRIEYGDPVQHVVEETTMGGHYVTVQPGPVEYRAQVTPAATPPPPAYAPPPPQAVAMPPVGPAVVTCSGNDRVRIHDRVVDGRHGPAIIASGNCVVEVTESVVRGAPAVSVHGNAQVQLVECRVRGDLVSSGNARIDTRGTRHRGQVLRGHF